MTVAIDFEQPEDAPAIEALLDEAFGSDRLRKQSYRYRAEAAPISELCLVARDRRRLVGSVRFWPVVVVGEPGIKPALLLGPIGVVADRRSEGVGEMLMQASLRRAEELRFGIVLLVGDLSYYGRFGFHAAAPYGIRMPGERPERLQVLELEAGALANLSGDLWPAQRRPLARKRKPRPPVAAPKSRRYGT
jgi:predicted N-acetyltransferase YhbS